VCSVYESVEDGIGDGRIAEHRGMLQSATGSHLMSQ
jgi:hypothetical protein